METTSALLCDILRQRTWVTLGFRWQARSLERKKGLDVYDVSSSVSLTCQLAECDTNGVCIQLLIWPVIIGQVNKRLLIDRSIHQRAALHRKGPYTGNIRCNQAASSWAGRLTSEGLSDLEIVRGGSGVQRFNNTSMVQRGRKHWQLSKHTKAFLLLFASFFETQQVPLWTSYLIKLQLAEVFPFNEEW